MQLGLAGVLVWPGAAQERLVEQYLESGRLAEGRAAVESALQKEPASDSLRFQLGLVQFFGAVERFSQGMYRYGLHESIFHRSLPFLRFPVEINLRPEQATNAAVRQVLQRFLTDLAEASKTLALIPDGSPVHYPLRFGRVRLDLNGDGKIGPKEELWRVMAELTAASTVDEKNAARFGVHLDAADARWLEGYCHLIQALGEVVLAYDTSEVFARCGHLFFSHTDSPYGFLLEQTQDSSEWGEIFDAIAFVHLLNFPLLEGPRLEVARQHLLTVIALSRRSWDCILAESDDRYEWIPGPRQRGVVPGARITPEMIASWRSFLDESEALLEGKKLLPFWRGQEPNRGVNLRKVLTQPRPLDAVLWLQGTAAAPYLEEGPVSPTEFWRQLNRAFRGNFLGFAIWFN